MLQRILVGAIFAPTVLGVLFLLPPVWTAVMVAFITSLASYELLRATKVVHNNGTYLVTALSAGLIPLGVYLAETVLELPAAVPMFLCGVLLMCALFAQAILKFGGSRPFLRNISCSVCLAA